MPDTGEGALKVRRTAPAHPLTGPHTFPNRSHLCIDAAFDMAQPAADRITRRVLAQSGFSRHRSPCLPQAQLSRRQDTFAYRLAVIHDENVCRT